MRVNSISPLLRDDLLKRKAQVDKNKAYYGREYQDHNFVICFDNGRPIEPKRCSRWFKKWQKETDLDLGQIVFHQIRHSSSSYKLALSEGYFKSVQSELGDSSLSMATDVYGHVLKSRKDALAEKFDKDFYGQKSRDELSSHNTSMLNRVVTDRLEKDPVFLECVLRSLGADNADFSGN